MKLSADESQSGSHESELQVKETSNPSSFGNKEKPLTLASQSHICLLFMNAVFIPDFCDVQFAQGKVQLSEEVHNLFAAYTQEST